MLNESSNVYDLSILIGKTASGVRLSDLAIIMLAHKGQHKAVKSKTIAEVLGKHDSSVRSAIHALVNQFKFPVIGSHNGYFVPENRLEFNDYINSMEDRLKTMRYNYEMTKAAYVNLYGGATK